MSHPRWRIPAGDRSGLSCRRLGSEAGRATGGRPHTPLVPTDWRLSQFGLGFVTMISHKENQMSLRRAVIRLPVALAAVALLTACRESESPRRQQGYPIRTERRWWPLQRNGRAELVRKLWLAYGCDTQTLVRRRDRPFGTSHRAETRQQSALGADPAGTRQPNQPADARPRV